MSEYLNVMCLVLFESAVMFSITRFDMPQAGSKRQLSEYECCVCVCVFFKLGIFSNTSKNFPMRFCLLLMIFLLVAYFVYPNGISIINIFNFFSF